MDPSFLANLKHYSSFKVELLAAILGLCYIIEIDNNYHRILKKKQFAAVFVFNYKRHLLYLYANNLSKLMSVYSRRLLKSKNL
jgi:hypothetical protein